MIFTVTTHHSFQKLFDTTNLNAAKLNDTIKYERDYYFDYFGFKTLERSYLMRLKGSGDTESTLPGVKQDIKGRIVERPQHMFMRYHWVFTEIIFVILTHIIL